jgi:hypothetical protein
MVKRAFLSIVATGSLLGIATPAAAYIFGGSGLGPTDDSLPPDFAGSIVHHDRVLTSRDVAKSAAFNAPMVGAILPFGLGRGISEEGYTGRFHLPQRSFARWDLLDNARRHRLGLEARNGDWRILNLAGDPSRHPLGVPSEALPPAIVRTGSDYDRPTRRDIRDNGLFNVNDRDRDLLAEMAGSSR